MGQIINYQNTTNLFLTNAITFFLAYVLIDVRVFLIKLQYFIAVKIKNNKKKAIRKQNLSCFRVRCVLELKFHREYT